MPDTITGLLVIIFAFLPGFPADRLYQLKMGSDWRERDWQTWLRMLVFSLVGLVTYSLVAAWSGAPAPVYISPDLLGKALTSQTGLTNVLRALLGHIAAAAALGFVFGATFRKFGTKLGLAFFSGAWDRLAFSRAPDHWVVVGLNNGDSYAGAFEYVDTSVAIGQRDILLSDPARYSEDAKDYLGTGYKYLFLPGDLVASVGVLYDPDLDEPTTKPGESPFSQKGARHDG